VSTPQQKFVFNALRAAHSRGPYGVDEARRTLETAYAWLDAKMADREWAAGAQFNRRSSFRSARPIATET
jgi:glutathione S-transferase